MTYQTPWHSKKRDPGAYGHIIINEVVASLPNAELEEYERLQSVKRKKRSAEQQTRMKSCSLSPANGARPRSAAWPLSRLIPGSIKWPGTCGTN